MIAKKLFLLKYCLFSILSFSIPTACDAGILDNSLDVQVSGNMFQPDTDLEIWVPKLKGRIHIDGMLDDGGWDQAAKIGDFFETDPGDNVEPSVETEVRLTYDRHALYVAFHCYDDPATIRATLSDRDQFRADDIIFIVLDTFRNYQTAYQLGVNPYGLQVDIFRHLDDQDGTFDLVWHSAGQIVEDGWVCEISIPFKSLRFPDKKEQEWGFHCIRFRPRGSYEEISWAPLDRDDPCFLCQAGILKGIHSVSAGRNLEILPYGISFQTGSMSDSDDPGSSFKNGNVEANTGFNIKYGLTSDLTLDFAYEPDFSQVESDVAQIDINTTFALFYPEKRPFFLEGSDIFGSEIHGIYTRTINDPILAAKLTGRVNRTSLGFILAKDDKTPFIVPLQEQSIFVKSDMKSVSNILRLKQDVWEDSFVGLMATNREGTSGYNRLAGIDASLRFLSDYRLTVQALQSWTKEPSDTSLIEDGQTLTFGEDQYTAGFDGECFDGLGLSVALSRSARHWNFRLSYEDLPPTFRADNGFVDRNDFRTFFAWTGLLFRPDTRIFDQIFPRIVSSWRYDHRGSLEESFKERWVGPEVELLFKTQTRVQMGGLVVNDEHFRGMWHKGVHRGWLRANTYFSEFISGGIDVTLGDFIYRGDSTFVGYGHELSLNASVKFSSQFVLETTYEWDRLAEYRGGPEKFDGYILRNKATYQFTRRLFLRLLTQYNSFDDRMEIDPLISYKINPFTVFYAGSTIDFMPCSNSCAMNFEMFRLRGWTKTDRQFFVKFQYFIRL